MQVDAKLDFARRYCPKITFHPCEQHFPCSIEHLLQSSTLKRRVGINFETVRVNPSAEDLGGYVDQNYYVDISPTQLTGCCPVNQRITAPVYIAMVELDDTFIDIYYIFLYAFQGSATFRCWPPGKHFNVITHEFGRHHGDVEHCIVRTDLEFSKVISVGYETHDKLAWFLPGISEQKSAASQPASAGWIHFSFACRRVRRRRWTPPSLPISAKSCVILL